MKKSRKFKLKKSLAIALPLALGLSITVFVTALLFNVSDYGITIASFGATVFMILSRKKIDKNRIFGSYITATIFGYIFSRFPSLISFNVAMAVTSSVIAMTLLDYQHAPAIGMSLAIVLNKFPFWTNIIILLYILFILSMTMLLKAFLKNPQKIINFIEIEEEKIKWNLKQKTYPEYMKF